MIYDDPPGGARLSPKLVEWLEAESRAFEERCMTIIEGTCPECGQRLIDGWCAQQNVTWSASWAEERKGWSRNFGDDSRSIYTVRTRLTIPH